MVIALTGRLKRRAASPECLMTLTQEQLARLRSAESFEKGAAVERVEYFCTFLSDGGGEVRRLLDLGCGNGYAVDAWRARGVCAMGVDLSNYRFSKWLSEPQSVRPFVVADARHLPFRNGVFDAVVSSGMIEHVGVAESRPPYRVSALPERETQRSQVIQEALRVVSLAGAVYLDFPNGAFPVDFWHGDDAGSFRVHSTPDDLLPTYWDVNNWLAGTDAVLTILPIRNRLRFKQIASRWWGRALRVPMRAFLSVLDVAPRYFGSSLLARLYPFLVIRIRPTDPSALRRAPPPSA